MAALHADVACVEYGVKIDASTPQASRTNLTKCLIDTIVSLDTFLCVWVFFSGGGGGLVPGTSLWGIFASNKHPFVTMYIH